MKKSLALVATVALAVAAASAVSAKSESGPSAIQTPIRATSLTPAERRWTGKVADLASTLSKAFERISELLGDPNKVQLILLGDKDEQLALAIPLGTMQACHTTLVKFIGRPPTRRFVKVYNLTNQACGHFGLSSRLLARGIDNVDVALIRRATSEMTTGAGFIVRATAEIKKLR